MRVLLLINIFYLIWAKFNRIAEINTIKENASKSYTAKHYLKSIENYGKLIHEYKVKDERLKLNLAHSYFHAHDTTKASLYYKELIFSPNHKIRSLALLQLGVISSRVGQQRKALNYFKEALKADPNNDQARFNYEIIKGMLKEEDFTMTAASATQQKQSKKQNKSGNQEEGERENRPGKQNEYDRIEGEGDQKGQKGEKNDEGNNFETSPNDNNKGTSDEGTEKSKEQSNKEKERLTTTRLAKIHISRDKALNILESLREEEVQYIQQLKKKSNNTDYDKNKPDW